MEESCKTMLIVSFGVAVSVVKSLLELQHHGGVSTTQRSCNNALLILSTNIIMKNSVCPKQYITISIKVVEKENMHTCTRNEVIWDKEYINI